MGVLTNPLQQLLQQAAKLPATGEADRYKSRQRAGGATVAICDCSGSMDETAGARRKIDHLREALKELWSQIRGGRLIGFSSAPIWLSDPDDLPAPSGGTDLAAALTLAAGVEPSRSVVISDGQPNDETAALAAAEKLSGRIDVLYCGPDDDAKAIDFMRRLARVGCGSAIVHDLRRGVPLLAPARLLLTGG